MDDAGGDAGRWLTYQEAGTTRGIKPDTVRRIAQRHRWRRQAGNDGRARVWVPQAWLDSRSDTGGGAAGDAVRSHADTTPPPAPDTAGAVAALAAAVDVLRQQLMKADLALDQARAEAREARQVAEDMRRADEARKARGRLRRAWDGWRGR